MFDISVGLDGEPLVHSNHTDGLNDAHPLAWQCVHCQHCNMMVHADNNECMTTWLEWGKYVLCARCIIPLIDSGVLELHEFVRIAKSSAQLARSERC